MNLETSATPQLKPKSLAPHGSFVRRVSYRFRQFWLSLSGRPGAAQLDRARTVLTTQEFELFLRMQPGEQVHSLHVLHQLEQHGHTHPNLLAAALLHDVGKIRYPLHLWERVLIVLASAVIPQQARTWGESRGDSLGWHKPFVVAQQHAAWGAELAAQAGSPPLTVALIRRHQEHSPPLSMDEEDHLLACLQTLDNES